MQEKIELSKEQIEELVDNLICTDDDINNAMSFLDIDSQKVSDSSLIKIYSEVFRCSVCGFWFDESDNFGADTCESCIDDDHNEDDGSELDEDDYIDYGEEDDPIAD
jgi:hypothetical protein